MTPGEKLILDKILKSQELSNAINKFDFKSAYSMLSDNYQSVPILTKSLLELGIDPAKYLKDIPKHFLEDTDIETYSVPNNILVIEQYAFGYCDQLESVYIPNSVSTIEKFAFKECAFLEHLTLEDRNNNHLLIFANAFNNCFSLDKILYEGTKNSFSKNVYIGRDGNGSIRTVVCSDGTISFG